MSSILPNSAAFDALAAMHQTGLSFGCTIGLYGAGFSIGKNIVRVTRGKINGGVAVANIIRDAAIFFGVSYLGSAFCSGAIQMANVATNSNVPNINVSAATADVTNSAVVESATDLAAAANDLIKKVTDGVFGMLGSTGTSVGDRLTESTAGTAMGGAVATGVETFGALGSIFGGTAATIVPGLIIGAVIGMIFGFIFDR